MTIGEIETAETVEIAEIVEIVEIGGNRAAIVEPVAVVHVGEGRGLDPQRIDRVIDGAVDARSAGRSGGASGRRRRKDGNGPDLRARAISDASNTASGPQPPA
ncbi:hypothetical protein [Burkholderia sp. ABCPW 14]|uniref:hypothetical protein n=1 Tax=Burkholderia sp. ABCPW 14 TaxID=1637860 RepID=UPI001E35A7BE|nr:hypothetical protein [Burkholderia sp. ABCPW 14]